jgi:hypothetical protein
MMGATIGAIDVRVLYRLSPDSAGALPGQALSLLAMPKHTGNEECPEDEDRLKHETQPIIPCAKLEPLNAAAL